MMKVYHGSCLEVRKPELSYSRETLDFGKGFYVTPIRKQALSWAVRWLHRGKRAVLNTYSFNDEAEALAGLRIMNFPEYNREWLRFVMANRRGERPDAYDIVRGGVANDKVFNTIELFFDGLIAEEEALKRLRYEKPNHQICICNQELLDRLLVFESAEEVSDGSQ